MYLTSTNNPRVKNWQKLHEKKHREKQQKFLIENEHLIQEAITAGYLEELILLENTENTFDFAKEVVYVNEAVMSKLKVNPSLPACMGVVKIPKVSGKLGNKIILCDDIQDPGNLGSMIRTAYSFGFDTLIVSNNSVDVYNEKVVRSTQGALFHLNIVRGNLLDFIHKLKNEDYRVYATALKDAKGLSTFACPKKLALVFGNEGAGVSEKVLAESDEKIFIEMSQFESLNVGIACGICAYWFRKG